MILSSTAFTFVIGAALCLTALAPLLLLVLLLRDWQKGDLW
jgi:hypothetical protein